MRNVVTLIALCLATAPVVAIQQAANVVTLSDDEMNECKESGGCLLITKAKLIEVMERVKAEAIETCHSGSKNRT